MRFGNLKDEIGRYSGWPDLLPDNDHDEGLAKGLAPVKFKAIKICFEAIKISRQLLFLF